MAALEQDPDICIWWATPVECVSALARKQREGRLSREDVEAARVRLRDLESISIRIAPTEGVKRHAEELLNRHPLRAADALQLGAALFFHETSGGNLPFRSEDKRLCGAAEKEGFFTQSF